MFSQKAGPLTWAKGTSLVSNQHDGSFLGGVEALKKRAHLRILVGGNDGGTHRDFARKNKHSICDFEIKTIASERERVVVTNSQPLELTSNAGIPRPAHAGRDQFAVLTARVDATSCSVSLENPNNRARGLAISDLRRLCGVSTLDNPLSTTK